MTKTLPLALLTFLLACSPVTTTAPAPAPAPAAPVQGFAPAGTAQRVVLLSLDGLSADRFASMTGLPTFTWLQGGATSTARIVPVNPTLTSVTHTSILTGATPDVHGVVSNRFHLPGTPMETTTRGMDVEPDVETLIDAAKKAGKRTGCISFPTMDASTPRRTCDFGLAWSMPVVEGRTITLTRNDFKREWVPPTWTPREQRRRSFSPIMRARVGWSVPDTTAHADVDFVVYDTTDDRTTNYDAIYVEADGQELAPDANGWFAVARGAYGSWSKVLTATASLDRVTVYWGDISRTQAWPPAFEEAIQREIGFWPGDPNAAAEPDVFVQQSTRLTEFLSRVQTLALERMPADLLLMYLPGVDAAEHHHFDDPSVVRAAYVDADRALNAIGRQLDWSRDAIVVTGDHGIHAMTAEVRMNRLLADGGFANWRAYASGSHAHLYRFGGADDSDALADYLGAQPHLEQVTRKSATAHRNSGDIVVYGKPNVILSQSADAPAVAPAPNPGQHGGLNHHRELHTLFFARGAGIAAQSFGEISQTRIARFVAGLLGIRPPPAAE
ncbi:MAG TPA: alkaline phosphatase family protein [Thermoanaerobaculia bacterium]